MTRTRIIVIAALALVVLAAAPFAWDFLKPTRVTPPLAAPEQRATRIVVEKAARRMMLERNGKVERIYAVALGSDPLGHKAQEGDGRTPEGSYAIDFKNPRSKFHLSLRISYPNAIDRDSAQQRGVAPGGDIMIHGLPNGMGLLGSAMIERDWTDGCVAVTNAQIEEIWSLVDVGTPVEIRP
jgi:murein L,D-transpeptidase YafK